MMPTWLPVKLTASMPRSASAMHSSAIETALAGGEQHVHLAAGLGVGDVVGQRDEVVGGLAHRATTTTTTSLPWRRVKATFSATARMRSGSATEVPPYFWTIRATGSTGYPVSVDRRARPHVG